MNWLTSLFSLSFLLWLIAIVMMDWQIRRVRNWMVLLGLVAGTVVLLNGLRPFDLQTSGTLGLLGMVVAFCTLLPFYAMRWMGAGDVKFAAVIGLWFGLQTDLLVIWVGANLLAGIHGLVAVSWRGLHQRPGWTGLRIRFLFLQRRCCTFPRVPPSSTCRRPDAIGTPAKQLHNPSPTRSIPYAGYMAITTIWLLLRG